jgi:exodeoxyribonuclease VII large subunit
LAELAHPDRPLKRGFARVTDRGGRTLTNVGEAIAARDLKLHFGDGTVDVSTGAERKTPTRVERKTSRPYVASQRGLFDEPEE